MKCPVCNIDLTMSDRQGVEIDYCPQCRGVWLDRGELDKIIERTHSSYTGGNDQYINDRGDHDRDKHGYGDHENGRRRRGGFLGGLFDD